MRPAFALTTLLLLGTLAAPAAAQAPDGAAVFQASLRVVPRAARDPIRVHPIARSSRRLAPESIIVALTSGQMFRQGSALTDAERRAVAGVPRRPAGWNSGASVQRRSLHDERPLRSPTADLTNGWNGWGDRRDEYTAFRPPRKAASPRR